MNFLLFAHLLFFSSLSELRLPINAHDIHLTQIGDFGLQRKARPTVLAHLHTGIDIKRPSENYIDEPIYSIGSGIVISKREDGPYAQLIIEHVINGQSFWTVYEHIAEIRVDLYEEVSPNQPIARFFNRQELNDHGWQFDHFHFEILKQAPQKLKPTYKHQERLFNSYTLQCFTQEELDKYFHNPMTFLFQNN